MASGRHFSSQPFFIDLNCLIQVKSSEITYSYHLIYFHSSSGHFCLLKISHPGDYAPPGQNPGVFWKSIVFSTWTCPEKSGRLRGSLIKAKGVKTKIQQVASHLLQVTMLISLHHLFAACRAKLYRRKWLPILQNVYFQHSEFKKNW